MFKLLGLSQLAVIVGGAYLGSGYICSSLVAVNGGTRKLTELEKKKNKH